MLSKKYHKLRKVILFVTPIIMAALNAAASIKLNVLLLIPLFLSLYSLNIRVCASTTIITTVLICSTFYVRDLDFMRIFIENGSHFNPVAAAISNTIMFVLEMSCSFSLIYPIFKYLINLRKSQTKDLLEKDIATDQLLDFCSTTTSYHSKYLSIHIKGVKELTKIILDDLFTCNIIDKEQYHNILFSVQFHDIGKIYINSNILDKNGPLSKDEFDLVKEHPVKGKELFEKLPKSVMTPELRKTCENVILQHHEKIDGSGYPYGLKESEISLEARIVAVADIADALLSWRPYKSPFTWEKVCNILLEENAEKLSKNLCNVLISHKDKVLEISNKNNEELIKLFNLSEKDVTRK